MLLFFITLDILICHCMCFVNAFSVAKSVILSVFSSLLFCFSARYILGEDTWVEYWPTRYESQSPQYKDQYIGISEVENKFRSKQGCTT